MLRFYLTGVPVPQSLPMELSHAQTNYSIYQYSVDSRMPPQILPQPSGSAGRSNLNGSDNRFNLCDRLQCDGHLVNRISGHQLHSGVYT